MSRKNKKMKPVLVDLTKAQSTYKFEGMIKSQAEMFEIMTKCGQQRFVKLHESRGELFGTLVDRLNPTRFLRSQEAEQQVLELRRYDEGHKISVVSPYVVYATATSVQ